MVHTPNARHALILLAVARPPYDAVVVDCGLSVRAPRTLACVAPVQAMFLRWPWLPVVLITGTKQRDRFTADVLLTGVHAVVGGLRRRPLRTVLHGALRSQGERVLRTAANVAMIRRVSAFLHEHTGDRPTLAHLAAMAAMSRSHFSRTFHAVNGMALRAYVADLRLKRAHTLLLESNLTLTAVAIDAGFYDLPHFDKAFRKRLGCSSQAFRRRYGHA